MRLPGTTSTDLGARIELICATVTKRRRVLARVCRAASRLEQAGRERARALASALAEGVPIRTLARRVVGQEGPVCHHEHAAEFWK